MKQKMLVINKSFIKKIMFGIMWNKKKLLTSHRASKKAFLSSTLHNSQGRRVFEAVEGSAGGLTGTRNIVKKKSHSNSYNEQSGTHTIGWSEKKRN